MVSEGNNATIAVRDELRGDYFEKKSPLRMKWISREGQGFMAEITPRRRIFFWRCLFRSDCLDELVAAQ
jgi:hypothetical protein